MLQASEREIVWILRGCAVIYCIVASAMAITVESIYGLLILCADLVYVVLFPQLVCVVHLSWYNTYGALAGKWNRDCCVLHGQHL